MSNQLVGSILDLGFSPLVAREIERELVLGWSLNKAREKQRERAAAAEAKGLRKTHTGTAGALGKQVLNVDAQQYWEIVNKYGYDAFSDREFIQDMQRLCPETKVCSA